MGCRRNVNIMLINFFLLQIASAVPLARYLNFFGVDTFTCLNPTSLQSFYPERIQGRWYQVHASWGADMFGCLWIDVRNTKRFECDIDIHWTRFTSVLNPLERGTFTKTYQITTNDYGHMSYSQPYSLSNPSFLTIVDSDYQTYILGYHCQQQWFDFYTEEYFDIYTRTGTISSTTLQQIKDKITKLTNKRPFDPNRLVEVKTKDCFLQPTWYIF